MARCAQRVSLRFRDSYSRLGAFHRTAGDARGRTETGRDRAASLFWQKTSERNRRAGAAPCWSLCAFSPPPPRERHRKRHRAPPRRTAPSRQRSRCRKIACDTHTTVTQAHWDSLHGPPLLSHSSSTPMPSASCHLQPHHGWKGGKDHASLCAFLLPLHLPSSLLFFSPPSSGHFGRFIASPILTRATVSRHLRSGERQRVGGLPGRGLGGCREAALAVRTEITLDAACLQTSYAILHRACKTGHQADRYRETLLSPFPTTASTRTADAASLRQNTTHHAPAPPRWRAAAVPRAWTTAHLPPLGRALRHALSYNTPSLLTRATGTFFPFPAPTTHTI